MLLIKHKLNNSYGYRGHTLLLNLFIFILIYFSNSSMGSMIYYDFRVINMVYFAFILTSMFLYIIISKTINLGKINTQILLIYIINILLTMLINQDLTEGYYVVLMGIIGAYCISNIISKHIFHEVYTNMMSLLALCSIVITYLVVPLFSFVINMFPIYTNEHSVMYLNMFLATPIINTGFMRNTGIFIEPGMYQVFLSYALIVELFLIKREIKRFNVIVLILTLITTFSPAAYIQIGILLIALIINTGHLRKSLSHKEIIILTVMICIGIATISRLIPGVRESLTLGFTKLINKESSYQGRTAAIIANIKYGFEFPLWGRGISIGFSSITEKYLGIVTTHNTSTTTALFAIFGISIPVLLTHMQYRIAFINKNKLFANILVFITLVMSVNSQLLIYSQLFYILCFSSYMKD